jgi:hypothetical protein
MNGQREHTQDDGKPQYTPPQVRTYRGDDLLRELGPAQALYGPVPFP